MRCATWILASLVFTLGLAPAALAQVGTGDAATKTPDPRVKALLEQLGYKFTITNSGNYRLEFETEDSRSQLVFINSTTQSYKNFEIREIWSTAYEAKGSLPDGIAGRLLEDTEASKLGFWAISKGDKSTIAVYEVRLAANADKDSLNSALINVIKSADAMEKELTGADTF